MSAIPHVLVLAAGGSERLGRPKQLVSIGGRPALHRVVSSAIALAGHDVTVVIGAHASELMPLLAHTSASVVVNRAWQEGMASSIRCGIAALPPGREAVMIVLGDQIALRGEDLKRLADAWNGDPGVIAASTYDQTVGVPAIFPHPFFPELAQLRGDRGARSILERNMYRLVRVPMPSARLDLDTPEQLAALSDILYRGE